MHTVYLIIINLHSAINRKTQEKGGKAPTFAIRPASSLTRYSRRA